MPRPYAELEDKTLCTPTCSEQPGCPRTRLLEGVKGYPHLKLCNFRAWRPISFKSRCLACFSGGRSRSSKGAQSPAALYGNGRADQIKTCSLISLVGIGFLPRPPSNSPPLPLSYCELFPRLVSAALRYASKKLPKLIREISLFEGRRERQPTAKNSTPTLLFLAPLRSFARLKPSPRPRLNIS